MGRDYTPVPDPVAVLRTCEERVLEREGIPMFLGLEDCRGAAVPVTDDAARAEGPRLAGLAQAYAPAFDAEGAALAAVALQVTAYAHFADGTTGGAADGGAA